MASGNKSSSPPSPKSPNSSSSTGTHMFGSHAPAIRKAMLRLEAEFGHPHISLLSKIKNDNNVINIHNNNTMMMSSTVDGYNIDLTVAGSSQSHKLPSDKMITASTYGDEDDVGVDNKNNNNTKNVNDGRIHNLPCKKHGPYMCLKCNEVFAANSLTDQSPVVVAVNDDDQNQIAVADPPLIRDKVKLEPANN